MKSSLLSPLRSLLKQGRQTIISVIGLSVAISSCILIILYISYELSYDRYHKNADSIYRVMTQLGAFDDARKPQDAVTPAPCSIAVIAYNVNKLAKVNPAETIRYE